MANNLFDWMRQNPDATPEQKDSALNVFNQIDNSVGYQPDTSGMNFDTSTQPQAIPQETLDRVSQESTPQPTTDADGNYIPQDNGTLSGFFGNLANLFTNPAFIQSAMAFGDSMAGNQSGFESNMNAYASTMDARRKEQAAKQQAKLARQQQLEDQASDRDWRDRSARNAALYSTYTPESVDAFNKSGRSSDLVLLPMTAAQALNAQQNERSLNRQDAALERQVANDTQKRLDDARKAQLAQEKEDKKSAVTDTANWDAANNDVNKLTDGLNLTNSLLNDDAFNGYFGPIDNLTYNFLPGAQRVEGNLMQLGSKQFLDNVAAMKGLGALSNAEGSKIQSAATALFTTDKDGNPSIRQGLSQDDARKLVQQINQSYAIMIEEAKQKRDALPVPQGRSIRSSTATQSQPSQSTATKSVDYAKKYGY